jgi:hypothetical protein
LREDRAERDRTHARSQRIHAFTGIEDPPSEGRLANLPRAKDREHTTRPQEVANFIQMALPIDASILP